MAFSYRSLKILSVYHIAPPFKDAIHLLKKRTHLPDKMSGTLDLADCVLMVWC